MLREALVFGPVVSRRLGASLGINLLPTEGKLCNFDCVYCECGWNRDGRGDRRLPAPEDLQEALSAKLEACRREGVPIDSITFSGDGEPTLHPAFARMIEITLTLRDLYFPEAKVSVLTNATLLDRPGVTEALRKVDNPILKLDGASVEAVQAVNRPVGPYSVEAVVQGMARFHGEFVLQTMFLHGPGLVLPGEDWRNLVRRLHPREVQVYTIARETPAEGLSKCSVEEMRAIVQPLMDEGFNVKIYG